ncbi:MAG: glycoside hydrolase family 127 protein [Fimbriimonadales bacterium]|nr:glycoside hydrolase family 127 protein [Fimbriimonadales bacterium]
MASPWRVRLLPGPFREAMEANGRYLLSLEPMRLLHPFHLQAGLVPLAEPYGGWERTTIAGHTLGHYLSACSWQFAASGEEAFAERLDAVITELDRCQRQRTDGYVGGVPESERLWGEIRRGEIRSQGFDLNGIWVPWYNLHKLLQGLLDAAEVAGKEEAVPILSKLADWVCDLTAGLDEEQWQRMLACEFGGMNDAMAHAFELVGRERWLETAKRFDHRAVMDPLERGEDALPGLHGNTQIPKVLGAARLYRVTGEERYRRIAENFFQQVVEGHLYAVGGVTSGEYFGPTGQLSTRLTMSTAETCKTHNLIRLAHAISAWRTDPALDDYVERALWNHILPSQDRETGMFCYFLSLHPGHFNTFSTPDDSFWCCVGTGMENHARYGESLYRTVGEELQVCQYVPSTLDWREAGLRLRLESDLPGSGRVRLIIEEGESEERGIDFRCPPWAGADMEIRVDGRVLPCGSGGWRRVSRAWKAGDVVEIDLPLSLRWEATPDDPSVGALAFGPVVLAGDLGQEGMEAPAPFSSNQYAYFGIRVPPVPSLVTDGRPLCEWLERTSGQGLRFRTRGVGRPAEVELRPLFQIGRRRYSVYWRLFTSEQYLQERERLEAEHARLERLREATLDFVQLGEMQPEREHEVGGEKTEPTAMAGEKMRLAWHGGRFSLRLKNPSGRRAELIVSYWGADGRNRAFEVVANGQTVALERFELSDHNRFFDRTYALPASVAEAPSVHLEFRSVDGKIVGPVCSCRLVRASETPAQDQ